MNVVFKCKELDLKGQVIETFYRAESKTEAENMIRAKGHTPVKVDFEDEKGKDVSDLDVFKPKVKVKDIAMFCKQLHTMLNAGMPLITSLDVLSQQSDNKTLRQALREMTLQVQKGDILSMAMKAQKKIFPILLINMVEAGELTGNLDNVLSRMSDHFVKENKINSKIKGAMIYPMILSVLVVVVVVVLLVFVMPVFMKMFTGSGVELPLPTRILLGISDSLKNFWYIYIGVIALATFLFSRIISSKEGKRTIDQIKFKIPVINVSVAKIATSRFTRTLSTLLGSGIPILQALESAANVTNNTVVIEGVNSAIEGIKKGSSLSILLKKINVFPPMMISMVSIGEESGALEEMLEKTADYYDEELETAIQRLISIMEPMMIVVMAVVIGFIVISMMMPMFDMLKTVK